MPPSVSTLGTREPEDSKLPKESRPKAHGSSRLPELDALRGLLLILMTLTHLPTHASNYANQPLGFVSAAEGFIFLSALLTGRVFGRSAKDSGWPVVFKRLWMRALQLYGYHLFLLAVAFTAVASVAVHTKRPALQGLLDFYLAHRTLAIGASVLLIYRPPLLDILPMYIIFLLETPLALYVGQRWSWKPILVPSALIWLLAQFGLRAALHAHTVRITGLPIPLNEMGAFDLLAWQFLWAVGLWIGAGGFHPFMNFITSKRVAGWVTVLACLFFLLRHAVPPSQLDAAPWSMLLNKWSLGALRLSNFAVLALLFTISRSWLTRWIAIPPLLSLGKASLEVFCAQLLFCFGALSLAGDGAGLSPTKQCGLIAVALVGLYLVAQFCEWRKRPVVPTPVFQT